MESLGDQIWNEMNDQWAEYVYGEGNSPALVKVTLERRKKGPRMWLTGSHMRCGTGESLSK